MAERSKANGKKQLYTLLAVGKTKLLMSEAEYREFLHKHGASLQGGKYSAKSMSIAQLLAALEDMRAQGFMPSHSSKLGNNDWRSSRIRKIAALWCTLADAGEVRDRSYGAMESWCSKQTTTRKLEWTNGVGLNNCIEALKSWCARKNINQTEAPSVD